MAKNSPPTDQDVSPEPLASVRVLVVDDYQPWRRWVRDLLRAHDHLHVVGQATDGLTAVQKTQELKPDVILLDIGLPVLNGIEASHRIKELVPDAKVILVTNQRDADIAMAALSDGARGYILKCDAASDLLPGIKAVLEGKRFVSRSVTGHNLATSD